MHSKKELFCLDLLEQNRRGLYGIDIVKQSDGVIGMGGVFSILSDLEKSGAVKGDEQPLEEGAELARTLWTIKEGGIRTHARQISPHDNLGLAF